MVRRDIRIRCTRGAERAEAWSEGEVKTRANMFEAGVGRKLDTVAFLLIPFRLLHLARCPYNHWS
jgi:hypothetical protein